MKTTFSSCILLLIIFTACKKDSGSNASHKLKAYTEDFTAPGIGHLVETFNVNYDEQDRITSIVSATKPGHRFVYQYISNDQFTFDKYQDDKVTVHNVYFINSSLGLVDSTWLYTNQKDTSSIKYIYNNDKKLVKQKEYVHSYHTGAFLYNTVNYQYDLKGTLTKASDSFYETTYRYDTACTNTVQTQPFYFTFQKQLPSHEFTTRWGTTITVEHSYSFDAHQRLISDKAVSSDGRVTIKTYTYQ
jgi:hypothetical protein